MKTNYKEPILKLVNLDANDLICTSYMGTGTDEPEDARERRNAIWDD